MFNYEKAFSRNIGFLLPSELEYLKNCRVAIAGMGGVGGIHLITLTRLGIGNFHIADFDEFEIHNFNRQAGASMKTLGKKKVDVMAEQALDINPELHIKKFPEGVTESNIDAFLDDVDIYVDGLDAFVVETREFVFKKCYEKGIPAITVGPLGMSSALVNFLPGKMTFEEYFGLANKSYIEKMTYFLLGVSPSLVHSSSLLLKTSFSAKEKKASSTPMGCVLAAGVMGTEVLKILLHRGKIYAAPWSIQYDAYSQTLKKKYIIFGHKNPFISIKRIIALRYFKGQNHGSES